MLGCVSAVVGVTHELTGGMPSGDLSARGCRHRPGIGKRYIPRQKRDGPVASSDVVYDEVGNDRPVGS